MRAAGLTNRQNGQGEDRKVTGSGPNRYVYCCYARMKLIQCLLELFDIPFHIPIQSHIHLPSNTLASTNYPYSSRYARRYQLVSPRYRSVSTTGGKGTPRRKVVKKSQASSQGDDRKLQAALKKLNVTQIAGVEEVNMFKDDGNVLHFASPRGEFILLGIVVWLWALFGG